MIIRFEIEGELLTREQVILDRLKHGEQSRSQLLAILRDAGMAIKRDAMNKLMKRMQESGQVQGRYRNKLHDRLLPTRERLYAIP